MDKELVFALQCRLRVLDGTAGGYSREERAASLIKLRTSGIDPNNWLELQDLLALELKKG